MKDKKYKGAPIILFACDVSAGRLVSCKDAVGGLKTIWFINYDDMPYADLTFDVGGETITAVASTPSAYRYDLHLGNDLTQNITSSPENGTTFFEQVLSLTLKKLSTVDNGEIRMLAYGRPKIMVEDNLGQMWLVGANNGADITGGTAVTGAAYGDLNGYTLTFTASEITLANLYTGDFGTEFTEVVGT